MMLPLDFFYRSGRSLISALVHVSPLGALGSVLLIVRRLACGVGAGAVLCTGQLGCLREAETWCLTSHWTVLASANGAVTVPRASFTMPRCSLKMVRWEQMALPVQIGRVRGSVCGSIDCCWRCLLLFCLCVLLSTLLDV